MPLYVALACIVALIGLGGFGLAPMHAWLPDAHAEGPPPISAVLSGLLLNVALYAVLRFKMLLTANPGGDNAGADTHHIRSRIPYFRGFHAL